MNNTQTISQEKLNEVTQFVKDNPDIETSYQVWWDDGEHGEQILLTKDLDEALTCYQEQVDDIPNCWEGHDLQEVSLTLTSLDDEGYADEDEVELLILEVENPNL